MPQALELVCGQVTNPGGAVSVLTMNAGNTATVRYADVNSYVGLIQTWANFHNVGFWRIRSPKLHDAVQGLRYRIPAVVMDPLVVPGLNQRLVPQDTLILELNTAAGAGVIEQAAMLLYYKDLPGNSARLIGIPELKARTQNMWTTEISIAPGVAGGYSGQVAINSLFDNFKANTDYALVGYTVDVRCTAVRFLGPDFSGLGIGGPGLVSGTTGVPGSRWVTQRWFYTLTEELGVPLIPVINSANKFGTLVDVMQDNGGAAVIVTAFLHELAPPNGKGFSFGIQ
jgi:hypothetical protein